MGEVHIVTVWNPLYTRDVDQHFSLLLDWARKFDDRKAGDDDLYVWWGKVRSPNRQQPLPRKEDVEALASELNGGSERETHLYVTDYRSLYVGELLAIQEGQLPPSEQGHVPEYYREKNLSCDFWFKLGDMRRLVANDLPMVAEELRKLRNVHYHDKPVSLYGGMVDLPLVVTRPDGTQFFDPEEREVAAGDRLWVEYDAEMGGGIAAIERDLRENVLGEQVWSALEWTARTCVAGAEKLFREHRDDPAFDFSPVILNFAKAVEVQCNRTLRAAAQKLPVPVRHVNVEGRSVDLAKTRGLTLGQLAHAIASDRELNQGLAGVLANGGWFAASLPSTLDALRDVRNPGAHEKRIDRDTAARWRNQLLGVGCEGVLVDLAKVRLKS